MSSSLQMQVTLSSDATIQGLVYSWLSSTVTNYAIFDLALLPENISTDSGIVNLDTEKLTLNHFDVTSIDGSSPIADRTRQVSCRGYTQGEAEALQDAAFTALNRVKSADGKAFFVCSKEPVLTPSDNTDNYNAPLSVRTLNIQC